jgi:hypothetical protein
MTTHATSKTLGPCTARLLTDDMHNMLHECYRECYQKQDWEQNYVVKAFNANSKFCGI